MKINENATSGATSSGAIATVVGGIGGVQRRLHYPLNKKIGNTKFYFYDPTKEDKKEK